MGKLILILMIIFSQNSFSQDELKCSKNKDWILLSLEDLSTSSLYLDVTPKIEKIKKVMRMSCETSVIKDFEEVFQTYQLKGYRSHFSTLKYELSSLSMIRSPQKEIELMKLYQKKLKDAGERKIPRLPSQKDLDQLIALGKESSVKRESSCKSLDNRKYPLLTKEGRDKIRDQDSVGWCYAYAAADLVGHKIEKEISAIDMANAYNDKIINKIFNKNESRLEGGFVEKSIRKATQRGLCLESQLPSNDYKFAKNDETYVTYLSSLEEFYTRYHPVKGFFKKKEILDFNEIKEKISCDKKTKDFGAMFSSLDINQLTQAIVESYSVDDFIDTLVDKSCSPRIKEFSDISIKTMSATNLDDVIKKMDEVLNRKDIVSIGYLSSVLENVYDQYSGGHASTVVGRKFDQNSGSCMYLIRNSWGNSCAHYDSKLECENGNIWLPEEALRGSLMGIEYVD